MSKHTPGPWARCRSDVRPAYDILTEGGHMVAAVIDIPEMEANAKLIAAAPRLLHALIEFEMYAHKLYETEELGREDAKRVQLLAQTAISEATGGKL